MDSNLGIYKESGLTSADVTTQTVKDRVNSADN